MDYYFNRASGVPTFTSFEAARDELINLLRGLATIDAEAGRLPVLRMHCEAWEYEIASQEGASISLGQLAQDLYEVDHDAASYFDALQRMSPSDSHFNDDQIEELFELEPELLDADAEWRKRVTEAFDDLSLCAVGGGLLISFERGGRWNTDSISFRCKGREIVVDHVSCISNAARVNFRRRDDRRTRVTHASFWLEKDVAFPNLAFGRDVERQLNNFSAQLRPIWPTVIARLSDLDDRVGIWRSTGSFLDGVAAIHGESSLTMNSFGSERKFKSHNGETKTFEDHVRITRSYRIHLLRDQRAKTIEIGYIGPHLPTVSDRT